MVVETTPKEAPMKITSITLNRTENLGNYQSRRLSATVDLDSGDTPSAALQKLRRFVDGGLASPPSVEEAPRNVAGQPSTWDDAEYGSES